MEKDPTRFCTYEEFQAGADALKKFCLLRAESVSGQLEGAIPSTADGQSLDQSSLIDASDLNISDMGDMNNSRMGNIGGGEIVRLFFFPLFFPLQDVIITGK